MWCCKRRVRLLPLLSNERFGGGVALIAVDRRELDDEVAVVVVVE